MTTLNDITKATQEYLEQNQIPTSHTTTPPPTNQNRLRTPNHLLIFHQTHCTIYDNKPLTISKTILHYHDPNYLTQILTHITTKCQNNQNPSTTK